MSILKKLFGTLSQKPWEENQAAIESSFWLFIDKNTGNIINKKITRQPAKMLIEVFIFIVVK